MRIEILNPVSLVFFLVFAGGFPQTITAQFQQKGHKIDPFLTAEVDWEAEFGTSVSLSADGKTAIIGAPYDKGDVGAAFIYTLTPCGWEMTKKLVGSGGVQGTLQGYSVDLSADGNTAIIGAPKDNASVGAAWIFTKTNGIWGQVKKLTPSDASGAAKFGTSVALSADGNTAIIGGPGDNGGLGAAWIFRRSGGWAQAFSKMLGATIRTTATYPAQQGISVDISGDGSTAVVGASGHKTIDGAVIIYAPATSNYTEKYMVEGKSGVMLGHAVAISQDGNTVIAGYPRADSYNGGIAVFVRSSGAWSIQLDDQLTAPAKSHQGVAVALSADGNTAIVGGGGMGFTPTTIGQGQTWVMTRSGSQWFEQTKYIGIPSSGNCQQGSAVAISGNGKSFLTAGFADNNDDGAAWFFTTDAITIPVPSISDFTPKSAKAGQTVTITGTDFSCVTDVSFGNGWAEILSNTNGTTITVKVPNTATSGEVCVYALGGKDCMAGFFYGGSTSPTSIAQVTSSENRVQLYPNPAGAELTLQFSMPATAEGQVAIFDLLGRLVYSQQVIAGVETLRLDITALPSGIYRLTLPFNGATHNYTFIKK